MNSIVDDWHGGATVTGLNKIWRDKDVIFPTNCLIEIVNVLVVVLHNAVVNHGQSERHKERGLIASSHSGTWMGLLRIPWTAR